jgi:lytic murein transglycosylase
MRKSKLWLAAGALLYAAVAAAAPMAPAAPAAAPNNNCRNTGNFDRWLDGFKREAAAQGISQRVIAEAAPFMLFEQRIVNIDRGQRIFQQNFVEFSDRMVAGGRIPGGIAQIKKHASSFARIEQQYGVPAAVIVAFWGLESDFGANMGKEPSLRALTTLAFDCRRSEMFRGHLIHALRLIERGDVSPHEMIGSWAGELGQNQMMPTEYFKFAVDFDGDGRRNLIRSEADVLGSTANYLTHLGWRRGEPWLQEVRLPGNFSWEQADLTVKHPRSQWVRMGVTLADGRALPADSLAASVLLPMGRFGPAFLAYPNFDAYLTWNNSLIYSVTAAYYATRLAGAPPVRRPAQPVPSLNAEQTRELQQLLVRRGLNVGTVDGKIGLATRAAIRTMQMKLGMPADSYPTVELIDRLRQ